MSDTSSHGPVPVRVLGVSRLFSGGEGIRDVTLTVGTNEVHAIVGPNGSGKSTLLRVLTGQLRAQQGIATLFGHDCASPDGSAMQRVGALVDFPAFYLQMSASENLHYAARLRGYPISEVRRSLDAVQLSRAARQQVRDFSMGMKQRLGVALALLGQPRLLILDEPTSSVDPDGVELIEDIIREFGGRNGGTVLFTSHSHDQVERLATHVSTLVGGALLSSVHAGQEANRPVSAVFGTADQRQLRDLFATSGSAVPPIKADVSGTFVSQIELTTEQALRLQQSCGGAGIRIVEWRRGFSHWHRQLGTRSARGDRDDA